MGMYSASELRSKISTTKREIREFEPKVGKLYHLWIPKDYFYYLKKHFNIHKVPFAKNCKIKAVTCINTDPGVKKQQCPICDYIEGLWELYRKEKEKAEKKAIQNNLNSLKAEYIYVNAIDINNADMPFMALRLTKSLMEVLSIAIEDTPIENVIWQFKKSEKGDGTNKKVEYLLLESPNDPRAIELCEEYDALAGREFKDGGLIDLEKALGYPTTQKSYLELLSGEEIDDEEIDGGEVVDDEKPAKTKAKTKAKATKEADLIVDDESISLDDVDMEAEDKPTKAKKATKPVIEDAEIVDDDLELDDDFGLDEEVEVKKPVTKTNPAKKAAPKVEEKLPDVDLDELDDLDLEELDDLEEEQEEVIVVSAADVNKHKANKVYIGEVINALVADKKIKRDPKHLVNLKAAYSYLKKNDTTVKISQFAVDVPY